MKIEVSLFRGQPHKTVCQVLTRVTTGDPPLHPVTEQQSGTGTKWQSYKYCNLLIGLFCKQSLSCFKRVSANPFKSATSSAVLTLSSLGLPALLWAVETGSHRSDSSPGYYGTLNLFFSPDRQKQRQFKTLDAIFN